MWQFAPFASVHSAYYSFLPEPLWQHCHCCPSLLRGQSLHHCVHLAAILPMLRLLHCLLFVMLRSSLLPCPRLTMLTAQLLCLLIVRPLLPSIHHTARSRQHCACCAIGHDICGAKRTRSCSNTPDCLRGHIPRIDRCVDRPHLCAGLPTPGAAAVWLAAASSALCAVLAFCWWYAYYPEIACASAFWAAATAARRVLLHPL